MALLGAPRSSIIYQNADHSITLIDIPLSIAVAQGRSDTLLSTPPLNGPIEFKEDYRPKSLKTTAHKAHDFSNEVHHAEYKRLILETLGEIQEHVPAPWCMPRIMLGPGPQLGDPIDSQDPEKDLESRLREWAACKESKGDDTAFDLQKMMASLGATSEHDVTAADSVSPEWTLSYHAARESTNSTQVAETASREQVTEPWTSTFHNPENRCLELIVAKCDSTYAQPGQEYSFTIPPRSTLFLSDSTHSDSFRASFRQVTAEYTLPRHFDLVLLDPPWPNRSAKRKGAYEQVGGMPYLKKMLLNMDIDTYLEHDALVGVWVTNKKFLREHVVGPGGLFETWNVGLIEEWIWIKTTTNGEPMFDIDSVMRKPYEILLLGRAAPNPWTTMANAETVKRRVIAAVPDIHSRKPCLKELLEPHMPDAKDYSALEIFSRYLVSGWTSWGNEVLKFNHDYYWLPQPRPDVARQYDLSIRTA